MPGVGLSVRIVFFFFRLPRHDGERDGGRLVAVEVVRRILAVACGVGARALVETAQQRRHRL
eukprot:4589843-Prymnesium_polylepis.1